MQDELIEVVVKEAVYQSLEKKGINVLGYMAQISTGKGDYGTYSGVIKHLTERYGPVDCGSFQVLVRKGVDFPEAWECNVDLFEDKIPVKLSFLNAIMGCGRDREDMI